MPATDASPRPSSRAAITARPAGIVRGSTRTNTAAVEPFATQPLEIPAKSPRLLQLREAKRGRS